jgi:hypothetical protein
LVSFDRSDGSAEPERADVDFYYLEDNVQICLQAVLAELRSIEATL